MLSDPQHEGTQPDPRITVSLKPVLSIVCEPRLVNAVEAWNFDKPDPEFAFTSMIWEQDGDFYHYRREERSSALSLHAKRELFEKAILIPRDYYLGKLPPPEAPATRAESSCLSDPSVYFKNIQPYEYDPRPPTPADSLAHEMRVCEELRLNLHPNICRYLGYVPTPDGKQLFGLCFERHQIDLYDAVQNEVNFDAATVIDGVRRGLEHLHSLGYAHNDINPSNIVLDKNVLPVIIDFDSCQKIGGSLKEMKTGTQDFEHHSDVSRPENDFYGLAKVQEWLAERLSKCE
ncbi:kinase-like domain-containing protein [Mycena sp. CBHHK59/15]|nr:kinase-like domain-containing protein [Mycena sp. CBHHK59/15]